MDPREPAPWSKLHSLFVAMSEAPEPRSTPFICHVASHKPENYKWGGAADPRRGGPLWEIKTITALFVVLTTLNILSFKDTMTYIYQNYQLRLGS